MEDIKKPVMLYDGTRYHRIYAQHIEYVEADRVYSHIHIDSFIDGKPTEYILSHPLCDVEKMLEPYDMYVRIHRSYIVNIWKIAQIMGNTITLCSGKKLSIGEKYKDAFKDSFMVFNQPYPE